MIFLLDFQELAWLIHTFLFQPYPDQGHVDTTHTFSKQPLALHEPEVLGKAAPGLPSANILGERVDSSAPPQHKPFQLVNQADVIS